MAIIGVIYGVRLASSEEFRYVGLTIKTPNRRFKQHLRNARAGRKFPFYDWLRKHLEEVTIDVLETITTDLADLGRAEIDWIALLRDQGDRLLNLTDGGLGPSGVVWTQERRDAARLRAPNIAGFTRLGAGPSFLGGHSLEQREKWSKDRTGSITGAKNPNFGKFGKDHPSFGRVDSLESRKLASEKKLGELNPNFGRVYSPEERAIMSARTKGIPRPGSIRSAHTRHHTNKGVFNPKCKHCVDDAS